MVIEIKLVLLMLLCRYHGGYWTLCNTQCKFLKTGPVGWGWGFLLKLLWLRNAASLGSLGYHAIHLFLLDFTDIIINSNEAGVTENVGRPVCQNNKVVG